MATVGHPTGLLRHPIHEGTRCPMRERGKFCAKISRIPWRALRSHKYPHSFDHTSPQTPNIFSALVELHKNWIVAAEESSIGRLLVLRTFSTLTRGMSRGMEHSRSSFDRPDTIKHNARPHYIPPLALILHLLLSVKPQCVAVIQQLQTSKPARPERFLQF